MSYDLCFDVNEDGFGGLLMSFQGNITDTHIIQRVITHLGSHNTNIFANVCGKNSLKLFSTPNTLYLKEINCGDITTTFLVLSIVARECKKKGIKFETSLLKSIRVIGAHMGIKL